MPSIESLQGWKESLTDSLQECLKKLHDHVERGAGEIN